MKPRIPVFSYGLDLDLSLLHTVIGGVRPLDDGIARISGYRRTFSVSGCLPGIERKEDGFLLGAITLISAEHLQRMDGWLLSYRRQRLAVTTSRGLRCHCWVYRPALMLEGLGAPSLATLQAVVRGAFRRGLPDEAIEQLIAWRPTDRRRLMQAMDENLVFSASPSHCTVPA